jgi:hypothetical protein
MEWQKQRSVPYAMTQDQPLTAYRNIKTAENSSVLNTINQNRYLEIGMKT